MVASAETIRQVESIFREHLNWNFQGKLKFDPIRVELTLDQQGVGLRQAERHHGGDVRPAESPGHIQNPHRVLRREEGRLHEGRTPAPRTMGRGDTVNWRHLIEAAKLLAGQTGAPAPGRPRQAMLKRAVSTAYGAEFHALCSSNTNILTGISAGPPYPPEWTRTYRATEQRSASDRMNRDAANTSPALQHFGATFSILQEHRHKADYDPEARFLRSDVVNLIVRAETAIQAFLAVSTAERRALATLVLLRGR